LQNAATFWTYFSRRGSICSKTSKLSGFRSRKLLPLPSLATTSIVTMRVAALKVVIGSLSWPSEAEAAEACWPWAQSRRLKAMQTAAMNGRTRLRRRKKPPNAKGSNCALVLRQAQGDSLPGSWQLLNSCAIRRQGGLRKSEYKSLFHS